MFRTAHSRAFKECCESSTGTTRTLESCADFEEALTLDMGLRKLNHAIDHI